MNKYAPSFRAAPHCPVSHILRSMAAAAEGRRNFDPRRLTASDVPQCQTLSRSSNEDEIARVKLILFTAMVSCVKKLTAAADTKKVIGGK